MNNVLRVGLVAAAVVIIAVIAINLLPGSPAPGGEPAGTPEPSTAAVTDATPVPELRDQEPLEAGRYRVNAGLTRHVTVAVPSDWSASGGWVVLGPRGNAEPDGMAIRFYTLDNLAANPLDRTDGLIDPPLGPTVDDLVEAVVAHPAWTAGAPTDITIDGHTGQLVQFAIPTDVEVPADGRFYLSLDSYGGGIWGWTPGQTFDWYIVDVDGERLIIDAISYPGTSQEDLAAQREVAESVEFGSNP